MDKRLWNAVQELLDAAEYALGSLDRYSDYEDDPMGPVMVPNAALSAHGCLKEAAGRVEALMPPDPETPNPNSTSRSRWGGSNMSFADHLPWRDNLNWFGRPWKPRGLIMKAVDEVYYWTALALVSDWLPCPLGSWRGDYAMRARFYFEFRDVLENPEKYGDEPMTYADFNAGR